jgi:hypothetical protein
VDKMSGRHFIRLKGGGRTCSTRSHVEVNMETWLSGRKRLTANEVGFKRPRRFESSRLRKTRSLRASVRRLLFLR